MLTRKTPMSRASTWSGRRTVRFTGPMPDHAVLAMENMLDAILEQARSRHWIGCGDLASDAIRRSYYFKHLPDEQRFALSYVVAESGCWEWLGSKKPNGYGQIWFVGRNSLAHRVAYVLHVGQIPVGLTLDHTCRNRGCVNPGHLDPVTQAENMRRYGATITECPKGHPYDEANTLRRGPTGRRHCRKCQNERTNRTKPARRRRAAAAVVDLVIERASALGFLACEVCGGTVVGGRGLDWALHHRRGRDARSDCHQPQSLIVVHGADNVTLCHGRIHRNRQGESYDKGWLIHKSDPRSPLVVPVLTENGSRWKYLDDLGGYVDNPPVGDVA